MKRSTIAILILIVAAIAVGVGYKLINQPYEADVAAIEADIKAEFLEQRMLFVEVQCPSKIDWEVGRTFNCIVTDTDGQTARAEVTMENDEGDITWYVS